MFVSAYAFVAIVAKAAVKVFAASEGSIWDLLGRNLLGAAADIFRGVMSKPSKDLDLRGVRSR